MQIKKIGIIVNPKKDSRPVRLLMSWLKKRHIHFIVNSDLSEKAEANMEYLVKNSSIVITLGGDGTLLYAASLLAKHNVPTIGVNLGSLGFINNTTVDELFSMLPKILKGKFKTADRMMLELNIFHDNELQYKELALNDIVFIKEPVEKLMRVSVKINKQHAVNYYSDGLIVSTPTGSTAYSLSAGGPLIHPDMESMVVSPICAHTLTSRPLIISAKSEVDVQVEPNDKYFWIICDDKWKIKSDNNDKIVIKKSRYHLKLITDDSKSFFYLLKTKLNWDND